MIQEEEIGTDNASVLIVDDDIMNLEVHKAMVRQLKNINSDTALSGTKALDLIRARIEKVLLGQATMYRIILIDYSMPDMDGPQSAIAIREALRSTIMMH